MRYFMEYRYTRPFEKEVMRLNPPTVAARGNGWYRPLYNDPAGHPSPAEAARTVPEWFRRFPESSRGARVLRSDGMLVRHYAFKGPGTLLVWEDFPE